MASLRFFNGEIYFTRLQREKNKYTVSGSSHLDYLTIPNEARVASLRFFKGEIYLNKNPERKTKYTVSWSSHLDYLTIPNDARVASLRFFKGEIYFTRIEREKLYTLFLGPAVNISQYLMMPEWHHTDSSKMKSILQESREKTIYTVSGSSREYLTIPYDARVASHRFFKGEIYFTRIQREKLNTLFPDPAILAILQYLMMPEWYHSYSSKVKSILMRIQRDKLNTLFPGPAQISHNMTSFFVCFRNLHLIYKNKRTLVHWIAQLKPCH